MKFKKVINNILTLSRFWSLSTSDLAKETGLTYNGVRLMLENGNFKLDSLEKIATALKVPVYLLFADELEPKWEPNHDTDNRKALIVEFNFDDHSLVGAKYQGESVDIVYSHKADDSIQRASLMVKDQFDIANLKSQLQAKEQEIKNLKELNAILSDSAQSYKMFYENLASFLYDNYGKKPEKE